MDASSSSSSSSSSDGAGAIDGAIDEADSSSVIFEDILRSVGAFSFDSSATEALEEATARFTIDLLSDAKVGITIPILAINTNPQH